MPEAVTKPKPLYTGQNVQPAYEVRYDWTGWPSTELFPNSPPSGLFEMLRPSWESDGLRLLEHRWKTKQIHLTFSATPHVSPILCAARSKGRTQHALRELGRPVQFSRKVSLRTIGHNHRERVEDYLRSQVGDAQFADPKYADKLQRLVIEDPRVDLSQPTCTNSGRYWYNLHVVLVTESRHHIYAAESLSHIRDGCLTIANRRGFQISTGSFLPDHVHLALRGDIEQSPHEIVLCLQNNLAYLLGQRRVWMESYYVGTFGEYDMKVVRRPADSC
jgi:REP element-mobilizing transposase RayT